MEEQILKILQDKVYYSASDVLVKAPLNEISKEIADHFREFIEWKDDVTEFDIETQLYTVSVETHVIEWKTLDELYEYWWNEINKK